MFVLIIYMCGFHMMHIMWVTHAYDHKNKNIHIHLYTLIYAQPQYYPIRCPLFPLPLLLSLFQILHPRGKLHTENQIPINTGQVMPAVIPWISRTIPMDQSLFVLFAWLLDWLVNISSVIIK